MAPRKPRSDWKSKGAAELDLFDIPFAAKEYLQNQVGQVLKERNIYAWNDWKHQDLQESTQKERESCKKQLIQDYPGLLTGPHGASLRKSAWQPVYVLSAAIEISSLDKTPYQDALRICTVVWNGKSSKDDDDALMGLTFFNNHLDRGAHFGTFVTDGASTSRRTIAVGEKGKGFILATQYFHEAIERHCSALSTKLKTGVSFRVGHQIGELVWKKNRVVYCDDQGNPEPPLLQVVMDDLQPWYAHSLAEHWVQTAHEAKKAAQDSDEEDYESDGHHYGMAGWNVSPAQLAAAQKALKVIYKRRFTQNLSSKKSGLSGEATGPSDEISHVRSDEVCITVLGLPIQPPEDVFSSIYGVVPPPREWKASDAVTFFVASRGKTLFYHRDQLVPHPPALNKLSINYHGPLDISSDRGTVHTNTRRFSAYREKVAEAANDAFGTDPDLAKEIAVDIIQDDNPHGGDTIGRVLAPTLTEGGTLSANADAYRDAFGAAWHEEYPGIPANVDIYPHRKGRRSERALIRELGMHPITVSDLAEDILTSSGAYTGVQSYATRLLLASPLIQSRVHGINQLRRGVMHIFEDLEEAQITVRDYQHSFPRAVWDADNKLFAFALPPPCSVHQDSKCVCFVGPYLSEATTSRRTKERKRTRDVDEEDDSSDVDMEADETAGVFQAFMHAFNVQSTDVDHDDQEQVIEAQTQAMQGENTNPPLDPPTGRQDWPRQTARRGGRPPLSGSVRPWGRRRIKSSPSVSSNHVSRNTSPDVTYGEVFGYAGGEDDSDDDLYAKSPTPEPEAGSSMIIQRGPAVDSEPNADGSHSKKDVVMKDATSAAASDVNASPSSQPSTSQAVTPSIQSDALQQPATAVVSSNPVQAPVPAGQPLAFTSTATAGSELGLDDHLAAIQRIVNQQKQTVENAERQAEEKYRQDLDKKNARVEDLQKEVEELRSQLRLIQDLAKPRETGNKRPRMD
ncbi:hypothetical protein BD626DRAFT_474293 [Schizophyllum amplum]|uniref:Uncharacterized protein n=1 Tax=Schizophyllum amplum TaxID=97359 RepID=A0A550CXH5_9AGAR|nr:hypothetical protein BD626DRAFT_474293 [Auriculariopsis ampla]